MAVEFNATFEESEGLNAHFAEPTALNASVGEVMQVVTDDYTDLQNKPSINGVTLVGDKSLSDLDAIDSTLTESGKAADAKATGEAINRVKTVVDGISEMVYPANLLNFNDPDYLTGKYIAQNGVSYTSSAYNTSGYIPVQVGDTYSYVSGSPEIERRSMRFVCAYDENKVVIPSAGAENRTTYTVPEGVSYIRFSAEARIFSPTSTNTMFVSGDVPASYTPYFEPYYAVKNSALDDDYINGLINVKFVNTVTEYGLSMTATADSMTNTDTLVAAQNMGVNKNAVIDFYANFAAFTSVTVGHGFNISYGSYAVIDDTYLTVYYGAAQQMAHVAHGLTFADFIQISITQNNGARAKIHLVTGTGDYTLTDCSWTGCRGDVFAKTGGSLEGCILTAVFKDFSERLFLFGDSYVSMGDPARYPYYLVQQGYTHLLINGYGGRNTSAALLSFNNVMSHAVPKYAIWAIGMNDADTASAVNASWLSGVQAFIAKCVENGVTPILATIPNCPNQRNTFKNAWVKASGHRYIDFAKAVGAEAEGASWYTGMLSSDNVHPTALGAKALYARFVADVPEVVR